MINVNGLKNWWHVESSKDIPPRASRTLAVVIGLLSRCCLCLLIRLSKFLLLSSLMRKAVMTKPKKKMPSSLKTKLKTPKRECFWRGPTIDGMTQSMISRFIVCRERFRLSIVEGMQRLDEFNHRIEFGSMWHLCEEFFTKQQDGSWEKNLKEYTKKLCRSFPLQQDQIIKWYNVCLVQFSVYQQYWGKVSGHHEIICREKVFCVNYSLPSKRTVKLRGKWDEVFKIKTGGRKGIWLKENKTKGDIEEDRIKGQLQFDLQTMIYLIARKLSEPKENLRGVWYNVVRRPLSGGRHSIRQHKPTKTNPQGESEEDFYKRLRELIKEDADYFFMRWPSLVTEADYELFERTFLVPVLEEICTWWDWIVTDPFNPFRKGNEIHYRAPYGIYNIIAEGGTTDVDHYLNTGESQGLERRNTLFSELQ